MVAVPAASRIVGNPRPRVRIVYNAYLRARPPVYSPVPVDPTIIPLQTMIMRNRRQRIRIVYNELLRQTDTLGQGDGG